LTWWSSALRRQELETASSSMLEVSLCEDSPTTTAATVSP
jgi:hypothetical protein